MLTEWAKETVGSSLNYLWEERRAGTGLYDITRANIESNNLDWLGLIWGYRRSASLIAFFTNEQK